MLDLLYTLCSCAGRGYSPAWHQREGEEQRGYEHAESNLTCGLPDPLHLSNPKRDRDRVACLMVRDGGSDHPVCSGRYSAAEQRGGEAQMVRSALT